MSLFNSIRKTLGALPDIAWFAKTGAQLFGATFSGHDAEDDAHAVAKGISGVFGFKDERQMLVLFEKLEQRQAGAACVVNDYLNDHFSFNRPELTLSAKQYIKMQRNRFRAVVIDMGESEGEKVGKHNLIMDGKTPEGHTFKLNSEEEIRKNPKNNGLDLLLRMYSILSTPGESEAKRRELCTNYLKSAVANVPLVDPNMVDQLNRIHDKASGVAPRIVQGVREGTRSTAQKVHNYSAEQERKVSKWQRFINWL